MTFDNDVINEMVERQTFLISCLLDKALSTNELGYAERVQVIDGIKILLSNFLCGINEIALQLHNLDDIANTLADLKADE